MLAPRLDLDDTAGRQLEVRLLQQLCPFGPRKSERTFQRIQCPWRMTRANHHTETTNGSRTQPKNPHPSYWRA
jgi:hypothetical protein